MVHECHPKVSIFVTRRRRGPFLAASDGERKRQAFPQAHNTGLCIACGRRCYNRDLPPPLAEGGSADALLGDTVGTAAPLPATGRNGHEGHASKHPAAPNNPSPHRRDSMRTALAYCSVLPSVHSTRASANATRACRGAMVAGPVPTEASLVQRRELQQ
eukprot:m.350804 g.350804  ORF g.350804 m.350804 type:complete len:159 (+) comp20693_c0_seq25:967-1443(+)